MTVISWAWLHPARSCGGRDQGNARGVEIGTAAIEQRAVRVSAKEYNRRATTSQGMAIVTMSVLWIRPFIGRSQVA